MPFTYNRTVRFQDTDAAGVVYFANVLGICHEAYEESLKASSINLKDFFTNPPVGFPIVHASVDFLRPMFVGDKLLISLIPQKIGGDKFEVTYEITVAEVVVAKAITRHVCIDASSRSKQELTDEIVQWLETNRRDAEKPVRPCGSPTCSRSVSPWEKQLARRREKKVERDYVIVFWRNSLAIFSNCWRLILPWELRGRFCWGIQYFGILNLLSLSLSRVWIFKAEVFDFLGI